jgi:hypothetical protein
VYVGTNRGHIYFVDHWVGTYPGYRYDDEVVRYVDHIRQGIVLTDNDPAALLVLSGTNSRPRSLFPEGTEFRSEAEGYLSILKQCGWFGTSVENRTVLETDARDSYENLYRSIKIFEQTVGSAPAKVTVCGLAFKRERFEFHADTIRRLLGSVAFRFNYVGVNDPPDYVIDGGTRLGERETLEAFLRDPTGNAVGGPLSVKRLARDHRSTEGPRPAQQ